MHERDQIEEEFSFKNYFVPLTNVKAITWIAIIGIIVYFNTLFNGFIGDDFDQVVNNLYVHSISYIPLFFQGGTFYSGSILAGIYYKPVLDIFYSLIFTFFGSSAFIFHLLQIFLHIVNAILVFSLFKYFFSKRISFVLAVVFLIHPINAETVDYVADLQDVLFFFFGILALKITQKYKRFAAVIISSILLLFSVLSKETGILFIFITVIFVFIYQRKRIYQYLISSILLITFYSLLRFLIARIYFGTDLSSPISRLTLTERLINIPIMALYYFKIFFFPKNLIFAQTWFITKVGFINFYVPLIILIGIIVFLGTLTFIIRNNNNSLIKSWLFFLTWFVLGIGFHMQLLPLDSTVADRWFYFPMIGLLGLLTIMLKIFSGKRRIYSSVVLITIIFITTLLGIRTIVRNANWKDNFTLYSHDLLLQPDNFILQNGLGNELIERGEYMQALPYIKRSIQIYPTWSINWNNLGVIYAHLGQQTNAITAFQTAIHYGNYPLAYENLSSVLIRSSNLKHAKLLITTYTKKLPMDDVLWIRLAIVDEELGDYPDAIIAAERAYYINPTEENGTIIYLLQHKVPFPKLSTY